MHVVIVVITFKTDEGEKLATVDVKLFDSGSPLEQSYFRVKLERGEHQFVPVNLTVAVKKGTVSTTEQGNLF